MMWRLEPSFPLSVGLGPVSWPPGGLAPMIHQCRLGYNQFGHAHEGERALHGVVCSHTPAELQSRRRRQHVIPLP